MLHRSLNRRPLIVLSTAALALSLAACGTSGPAAEGTPSAETGGSSSMSSSPMSSSSAPASDGAASSSMSSSMSGSASAAPSSSESTAAAGHGGQDGMLMPASTGDPFADARTAAAHMPETAATMAHGFAEAKGLEGDAMSDAATLRAALTAQMQESTYLLGMTVATGQAAGWDGPEVELAMKAVQANEKALAATVEEATDAEHGAMFAQQWTAHREAQVAYVQALAMEDQDAAAEAWTHVESTGAELAAFYTSASHGSLTEEEAGQLVMEHAQSLGAAAEAMVAGETSAYATLRTAAGHAAALAGKAAWGVDESMDLDGDPMDPAASLRADLTHVLQEHVYLAGIAVFTAYTAEGGTDSEAFAAAAEALDGNTLDLAKGIGSLSDAEKQEAFTALWREHIGYFVAYAEAKATDDAAGQEEALRELDEYRPKAGAFFDEISAGELPSDAIAEGLGHHVETLAGAIDSLEGALVK